MNKVKTRTATIFIDENEILHIELIEGSHVDYEDAIDNHLVCKHLSNNQKVLKLLDARVKWDIDKKAEKFAESKEVEEKTNARAIVVGSSIQSVLSNFFNRLNKPNVPTMVFSEYDEAYKWLMSFK